MQNLGLKQEIDEIIKMLPENKLKVLVDFAGYLKNKEESEELLRMQSESKSYKEWISSENEMYDLVFKDAAK